MVGGLVTTPLFNQSKQKGEIMKYSRLIVLSILFSNLSFAQDTSKALPHNLKHGIQFQIAGLLNLISFNNYTFSYRYLLNNYSGVRISLLTNIIEEDYDVTQQLDSITTNPPVKFDYYNLKFSLQYLHSIICYNDFNLVLGGGPFFSYGKNESYNEYLGFSYISKYEEYSKTIGFGIDIVLDVEYSLSENVKLSGEYGLTLTKENSDIENLLTNIYNNGNPDRIQKEAGKRKEFSVRGSGVTLGMSVFF